MRSFVFAAILCSLLAASSAAGSGPSVFGQFDQRGLLERQSFYRHINTRTLRGGQEEESIPDALVDPEAIASSVEIDTDGAQKEPSQLGKKLANLKERTLPAVLMLGSVGALTYYTKEKGLMGLTLVLQMGMYEEMTNVIGGRLHPLMKWWWFLTGMLSFNAPRLLPAEAAFKVSTASFGMVMFGIVSTIIRLQVTSADAAAFREFMRQTAISAVSLVG